MDARAGDIDSSRVSAVSIRDENGVTWTWLVIEQPTSIRRPTEIYSTLISEMTA